MNFHFLFLNRQYLRTQVREESFTSYRSETEAENLSAGSPRPETPAFPLTPRAAYRSHQQLSATNLASPKSPISSR